MRLVIWTVMMAAMLASFAMAVHYRNLADEYRRHGAAAAVRTQPAPESKPPAAKAVSAAPASAQSRPDNAISGRPSADAASAATLEMEERIRELEDELDAKNAVIFLLQQSSGIAREEPAERPRRTGNWLEEMRQNNPGQYAEFTNRRERVRTEMQAAFSERVDHMAALDTSGMTENERAQHQRMTELLNETWLIADQLQAGTPDIDRREHMQAMRRNIRELRPLLTAERSREFYAIGLGLGYPENDAKIFADYITRVIAITSTDTLFRGGRGFQDGPRRPEP